MGAAASDYFTPYADIQYGFLGASLLVLQRGHLRYHRDNPPSYAHIPHCADAELAIEDLHELAAKGKYHRVSMRLKNGMDPNGKQFIDDDAFEREDSPMICAAR